MPWVPQLGVKWKPNGVGGSLISGVDTNGDPQTVVTGANGSWNYQIGVTESRWVADGPTSKGFNPERVIGAGAILMNHDMTLQGGRSCSVLSVENNAQPAGNVYAAEFTIDELHGLLNVALVHDQFDGAYPEYQLTSTMYWRSDGAWLIGYGNSGPLEGYSYQDFVQPSIPALPAWQPGDKVALVPQCNGTLIAYFYNGTLVAKGPAQYYTGQPWLFMADALNGRITVETDLSKMVYGANYLYPNAYGEPDEYAQSWPTP